MVTDAVANGRVPITIMITALTAKPNPMNERALLLSETLPIKNLDSP